MIVTYTLEFSNSVTATIIVPNINTQEEEVLLEHIQTKCAEHYNISQSHYLHRLITREEILILFCR